MRWYNTGTLSDWEIKEYELVPDGDGINNNKRSCLQHNLSLPGQV